MGRKLFLGIDTSNYTTSAAICTEEGEVLLNAKCPLPVKEGERGLRQSDAVFHHVKNLPFCSERVREAMAQYPDYCLTAVGCSATPRDIAGSYMPCFLSGVSAAEMVAATTGLPLCKVSHQAGHVMAALHSACVNNGVNRDEIMESPFIAFHVSGGTTDMLLCEPDEERIFKITQIGGTRDINGGQAIDRTGVLMGLSFPCGAEMDKAALTFEGKIRKDPVSVTGTLCNLSGLENKAAQLFEESGNIAEVSAYTLSFIGRTLEKLTLNAFLEYGTMPVLYAGGVMSSSYIKKMLSKYGMFSDPQYSADNAAGVALLTAELFRRDMIK